MFRGLRHWQSRVISVLYIVRTCWIVYRVGERIVDVVDRYDKDPFRLVVNFLFRDVIDAFIPLRALIALVAFIAIVQWVNVPLVALIALIAVVIVAVIDAVLHGDAAEARPPA